ncbi:hypothetical protein [Streptomyces sp. NPDC088766]|uniref:hypothetical protein n=1 Tax=Streptomyces sp. NPDC088766 TaxID=3365893 RepID=UPI003800E518
MIGGYEKAHFPDREVYGDRGRPELRLITCGGTFDRRSGHSGNLVVFARLTQIRDRSGPARRAGRLLRRAGCPHFAATDLAGSLPRARTVR